MKIEMAAPSITQLEIDTVIDCMENGWSNYNYVEEFERLFAKYHNRKYSLMTPNCTSALHLLLLGLGIGEGDEVIVPECTWIASAAPISYTGARPIFCDIEISSWCISPQSVEKMITPNTKAIIAVDLFGNMPNMDVLTTIASRHKIHLIEDSAEAVGSVYYGKKAGSFGVGSVFSFHRTKTICTGEGGMLLIDDDELFSKCQIYRDHGRGPHTKPYFNEAITPKYMPFNLQASLGYAQFKRIDELIGRKREMFYRFRKNLSDLSEIHLNPEPEGIQNGAWTTAAVFTSEIGITKESAIKRLGELGTPIRPFFYPLSSIPAYDGHQENGMRDAPNAYDISSRGINFPCAYSVTDTQIDFISEKVRTLIEEYK
jgi:perosamine synthetase